MNNESKYDIDVQIAYQNKDVFSKFTAENFKDKQLEIYGVHGLPKIVDALPTNLPTIQANELRLDNLFLFEDDSIGIIDYESDYSKENITKYLDYISRVINRWYRQYNEFPQLRLIILYTADVAPGTTISTHDFGCSTLSLTEGFLIGINGDEEFHKAE